MIPPAPHDPREREVVTTLGAWEVRQFPASDAKLTYFTPRGFLHLQLWHAATETSILTPSRLTRGVYEIADGEGVRIGARRWHDVAGVVAAPVPGAAELAALERWLVTRHEPAEIRLLRAWWAAGRPERERTRA